MGMLNAFMTWLAQVTIGESVTLFDAANSYVGVGDSTTLYLAIQTGLQAAVNVFRQGMDYGYPVRSGNTVIFQATIGEDDANYAWNEFEVRNAAAGGGTGMNRVVSPSGTKPSGEVWVLRLENTYVIGVVEE